MYLSSAGSLGINTTSPSSGKLQVVIGTDGTGITLERTVGGFFTGHGFASSNPYFTYYGNTEFVIGYGTSTGLAPSLNTLILKNTGQAQLPQYTTTTSFTGTPVGFLGFDSSGNILTTTGSAAGGGGGGGTSGTSGTSGANGTSGSSGSSGTSGSSGSAGTSGANGASVTGQIILTAGGGWPSITAGAQSPTLTATATNAVNFYSINFADGSQTFANWAMPMPSDYNGGTITAVFYWMSNNASTNSVVWGFQGRAYADSDLIDQAFGTAQTVTDANQATRDVNISAATAAITLGGTPAASNFVQFRCYRDGAAGGDTLAATAELLAIRITYTRA
jgi:hypothetical protein